MHRGGLQNVNLPEPPILSCQYESIRHLIRFVSSLEICTSIQYTQRYTRFAVQFIIFTALLQGATL